MATNGSPELLIVMGPEATPDQTDHVVARLEEAGVDARVSRGREATVIGAIGDRELLATLPVEGYPGVEQVLVFARSDLICYRAPGPDELAGRQAQIWDPLIAWAREHLSAPLLCTAGVGHVPQTPDALAALEKAIAANGDFRLAGLHAAATLTGSAVIALALSAGRLSFEEAFAAAELDEIYQRGKWGEDAEALRLSRKKEVELIEIAHFLYFVCGDNNPL
mgnify:CR=1 FL=1